MNVAISFFLIFQIQIQIQKKFIAAQENTYHKHWLQASIHLWYIVLSL